MLFTLKKNPWSEDVWKMYISLWIMIRLILDGCSPLLVLRIARIINIIYVFYPKLFHSITWFIYHTVYKNFLMADLKNLTSFQVIYKSAGENRIIRYNSFFMYRRSNCYKNSIINHTVVHQRNFLSSSCLS